jgi:hypothetical protein
LRYTGFSSYSGIGGWLGGLAVAALFIIFASRLPSVRANLILFSRLKLLALFLAVAAGLCEECIFRKFLMDGLQRSGKSAVIQIFASALLFGIVHGIWGTFRGNIRAAVGATLATGALGSGLALVYVVSHRNVAPAIFSHFLINAFAEPGLVLAAVRGEMGRSKGQ